MPQWASRIMLEIVNVRVEGVQDITRDDALAEGVKPRNGYYEIELPERHHARAVETNTAVGTFCVLWDCINNEQGKRWNDNPWVWVIEFKKVV